MNNILDDIDLASMIEPFGSTITAITDNNGAFEFTAIFDNGHKFYGDDDVFSNLNPTLTARTSDIELLTKTSQVVVNNTKRTIRDIKHDGWGITVIELKQ